MPYETCQKVTSLFEQAMQAFSDSLKATVKVQEDIAKFWMDSFHSGPIPQMQKKTQAIFTEMLPVAQKNGEEYRKLLEGNYQRGAALLKIAFCSEDNGGKIDLQSKTRTLWDASMEAMRDNAKAVTDTNMKVMQSWAEVIKESTGAAAEKQHLGN